MKVQNNQTSNSYSQYFYNEGLLKSLSAEDIRVQNRILSFNNKEEEPVDDTDDDNSFNTYLEEYE